MKAADLTFEGERGQWLDQVAADEKASAAALRVAIMISHYMNRDEQCAWASADRMAQDFGIDRFTILRGIRTLEERGHLDVDRRGGRRSSEYRWRLSGIIIRSEKPRWNRRSGAKSATTSETPCGDKSATAAGEACGGRFASVVVADFHSCGAKSTTQTSYEPLREPSRAGPGLQPGPGPDDGVPIKGGHPSLEGESISSSKGSERGDAPAAVPRGTAGAPVGSDEEEDWSFFGEVETEDTALSIYRGENNGWMPTRAELDAFAAERDLPISKDDLEDVAEDEALLVQDEVMVLADLRAGRRVDRFNREIAVPPGAGTATSMLNIPRRRAAYVAEACRMAEVRRPSDRAAFWQQRCIEITTALHAEAADLPTLQNFNLLNAEFLTELRRREAITHDQIERVRA